jgi:hypothetical protein
LSKYLVQADPEIIRYQYQKGIQLSSKYFGNYLEFAKYSTGITLNSIKEFDMFFTSQFKENTTIGLNISSKIEKERKTDLNFKALYNFNSAQIMLNLSENFQNNSISFYQHVEVPRPILRIFNSEIYNFVQDGKEYHLDVETKRLRMKQYFGNGFVINFKISH